LIKILYRLMTMEEGDIKSRLIKRGIKIGYPGVEGVILDTRPFDIGQWPGLKVISRVGVGLDNIDLEACKERDIEVFNTPCVALTVAVAEFTLMLILRLLKGSLPARNLKRMSVGIIGYGRIGCYFRTLIGDVLHCGVMVYDDDLNITSHAKGDLLENCDIVTIHVSGDECVIGEEELELMKDGSYLINTARRGCIDEKAVAQALLNGKLAGFASDVNYKMLLRSHHQNVILTSHVAGATLEAREEMEEIAVENLLKGFKDV